MIEIDSSNFEEVTEDDGPRIRIFINDARVWNHGEPTDPSDWL